MSYVIGRGEPARRVCIESAMEHGDRYHPSNHHATLCHILAAWAIAAGMAAAALVL